jgi:hypothetical protein
MLQYIEAVYPATFANAFLYGLRPALLVPAAFIAPGVPGALFLPGG